MEEQAFFFHLSHWKDDSVSLTFLFLWRALGQRPSLCLQQYSMLIFPSEYSARAPETQCLKMSTPTFFHLYRDTHLSTTMVYTVACDKASPRTPCFPSYFMAHFSRVIHDNSNKKLKMPIKVAQPPSPSFSQSHSKHRSFVSWQHPPYCDCFLCLIWVIASSSSTSSSKITFYSCSITWIQA